MTEFAKTSASASEPNLHPRGQEIDCDSAPSDALQPASRWSAANLFRNPFGELTRRERAELAVVPVAEIVAAIGESPPGKPAAGNQTPSEPAGSEPVAGDVPITFRPWSAYQMIGECGRGKTTRMLAIGKAFPSASYVYLPEDQPCPTIPAGEPLLIDEAQRLTWRVRRKVFASGTTLVLATHKDLSPALRRAGYTVTTEKIGLSLSVGKLTEILNRRIAASRRDPRQPVPRINDEDAETLIRRFGTDVRSIESYLYDIVQSQVNHHGEMRFID
ncbi:hypothetical protein Enr13x_77380 [Stieleria neptunia]|uniref:Uncharacterized protein n=1 Tax=Stieleria neptunia TaxID=2527979 RepID=A0A518I440_9BACT|nr:hypothetical protein [Stieleria neptunia]QDV47826.1 hypothetical protein Enr13x_77380 [Stieleria neptunia]